ncbi:MULTISPECIES: SDR family NAD(P)-dependent oxidoreductase [unclassified Streptomyces]|uniref:SDR family NAD(P)-dependent oxidoreductase n=1 Tax=unclassified Streptomyces TaxID=2593676 RepID=UPI0036EA092C
MTATHQRTALVTGAASGIGAAIATRLAARGLHIVLADRDEHVAEVARTVGGEALVLDVTSETDLARAAGLPRVDVLVNSAGVPAEAALDDPGFPQAVRRAFDVNLAGTAAVVGAVLPRLRASDSGRILNVGSVQGSAAAAGNAAYAASKGGLDALTRALAVDLAPAGILVNALAPGFVDTPMARLADGTIEYATDWFRTVYVEHGRIPLRRPARPDEIAAAAEFLVSPDNTYVTGAVLPVDGGLLATL